MSKFSEHLIRLLETREKSSDAGRKDGKRGGEKDKNERESGTKNTGKGTSKKNKKSSHILCDSHLIF